MAHYDLLVLGGGSAGYAAANTAARGGAKVALLDGAEPLGGLCILRGCMPSKTLLHVAEVRHAATQARELGLDIPTVRNDMPAVAARKRRIIGEFASYRRKGLESGRFELIREHGRFTGPKSIACAQSGRELSAEHILVATGSRVAWPAIPGLREAKPWTSDDVLELEALPSACIVLGGGVVACELAQYLHRMGVQVTQIQRSPRLLSGENSSAAEALEKALRAEGMSLHVGTDLHEVSRVGDTFSARFSLTASRQELTVTAPALLNALGRQPNTGELALPVAGVETTRGGRIVADPLLRTSARGIYAAGDVTGPEEIVHVAILQGEIVAAQVLGKEPTPINYDHLTRIVFTDPAVARVGPTEAELAARGVDFLAAEFPFDDHGKSITMNALHGHVKLWATPTTGQLLAAECVGSQGGELIHSMAVAISLGATAQDLLRTHWYHPTLAEIWTYPLEEIADDVG